MASEECVLTRFERLQKLPRTYAGWVILLAFFFATDVFSVGVTNVTPPAFSVAFGIESTSLGLVLSASLAGSAVGAVVLLLNRKAYYIIAVMFTQFLSSPVNDDVATVLAITTVFTLNNLVAFVVWTLCGSALAMLFRSERSKQWIDYLFAATLIGVAIWMGIPLFTPI